MRGLSLGQNAQHLQANARLESVDIYSDIVKQGGV